MASLSLRIELRHYHNTATGNFADASGETRLRSGARLKLQKPTLSPFRGLAEALRPFSRIRSGMTLGAQGVIIDGGSHVLLVRHSYRPGWYFPGGGVEWNETVETALARELGEEVGVRLTGPAQRHGLFANFASFPGDHIALFVVRDWERRGDYRNDGEIAEAGMFARQDLPDDTDAGTRARLAEIFDGSPVSQRWW